ncbi:MAG: response regulator transcription factor [Anaerolineae bacterium]|nr:response regulator transcription factor [Anaerolineae bacterium]
MDEQIKTLVVDDEEGIRLFLTGALSGEGHAITTASSGEEALEYLRDIAFDLVLLDLRLGGRIDGLRILQAVSWRWPQTATVILTGHGTLESAREAILEGLDAYLIKPVTADEVRTIVAEVLKKRRQQAVESKSSDPLSQEESPNVLRRGDFLVDLEKRQAELRGHPLDLTDSEYELLIYLMENDNRPVPPPELVKVVRGYECDYLQEARDVIKWYIYRLRSKVEPKPSSPRHILNVRGAGYIFKA